MAPLWIGLGNSIICYLAKGLLPHVPLWVPLVTMSIISASTWLFTLLSSPYSLWEIFVPDLAVHTDFEPHMRKALQLDELFGFGSSYLWLVYMFHDLRDAGIVGKEWALMATFIPVVALCVGPGAALAVGWLWRESVLQKVT